MSARPGSTEIVDVAYANGLKPARVTARVRGRGRVRRLTWTASLRRGQRVRFHELAGGRAPRLLKTRGRSHGTIRFRPRPKTGRRHTIVAYVYQDGVPQSRLTVAHFKTRR